jgi:hypothetical protein
MRSIRLHASWLSSECVAIAVMLPAVVSSCAPSTVTRTGGEASSSPMPAASDVKRSENTDADQGLYSSVFRPFVEATCAPNDFAVACYFRDEAECQRAFEAQWPACAPDAALPDSPAAQWAGWERFGECAARGALGKLTPRVNDPLCQSRVPKRRVENPYLDAGAHSPK